MYIIEPTIAVRRILDTVWTLEFIVNKDNTIQILGHEKGFHGTSEDEKQLPTYRLEESEGRIVQTVVISQHRDKKEETRYTVSNPLFVFSYPAVTSEVVHKHLMMNRAEQLKKRCLVEAFCVFLSNTPPEELVLSNNEEALMEFVEENKWEPFEDYETSQILQFAEHRSDILYRLVMSELKLAESNRRI